MKTCLLASVASLPAIEGCDCKIAGNWYSAKWKVELTCEKIANCVCQFTGGDGVIRTAYMDDDGVVHSHSYAANVDVTFDSTCNTVTWDTPPDASRPDEIWKRFAS